tara:strand:- start:309 stop:503 length:195 start_codon:yes stop_codon:yes gene_type:complete
MAKIDYTKEKTERLEELLTELKIQYVDKKLAIYNNTEKDTTVLSKIKKDTARIHTIINERKNHE